MDVAERVRATVEPLLASLDIELVEVEVIGSGRARTLRLSVDREGGVDLDTITEATRVVSPVLDAEDPISGTYTLEISSPGVERPLRHPADFQRRVGERIAVKTHGEVEGERRHQGVLAEAGDDGIVLDVDGGPRRIAYDEIAQARTVFEWGGAPKPGKKAERSS